MPAGWLHSPAAASRLCWPCQRRTPSMPCISHFLRIMDSPCWRSQQRCVCTASITYSVSQDEERRQQHAQASGSGIASGSARRRRFRIPKEPPLVEGSFADWHTQCALLVRSNKMLEWLQAITSLGALVGCVSSPAEAQEAWSLMLQLASHQLPPVAAGKLAAVVVELVERTLVRGDFWVLHQLLSSHQLSQPFTFGKRSMERLLRVAAAQDLDLIEFKRLVELVPPGQLSASAYFLLIRYFESKGLNSEALHCYQQVLAANLRPSPSMEAAVARLRGARGRSTASQQPRSAGVAGFTSSSRELRH